MTERPQTNLNADLVSSWIGLVRSKNNFYRGEIGLALEDGDPVALEFIRQAHDIDPAFVTEYYPGFVPSPMDQLQKKSFIPPFLVGLFSRLRDRT